MYYPGVATLLSTRAFLIRVCAAICDPHLFVFASVIILLSSMSKLIVFKKGIHLTLTNPNTFTPSRINPLHPRRLPV